MEAVCQAMRHQAPNALVRCAYLELCEPNLPAVVADLYAAGTTRFNIIPMFLGTGRHARDDLPALVATLQAAYSDATFDVRQAIGEDPRMTSLMAQIASE